jgi:hypothetical protein
MSQCIKEIRRKIKFPTQSSFKMPKFTKWSSSKDCNPNETHQQSNSLLQSSLLQNKVFVANISTTKIFVKSFWP